MAKINMKTTLGDIIIETLDQEAPITVENFINYIKDGFYDGTIFHRVIPGFVIQGGGHEPGMKQKKTNEPIKNEASNGLKNKRGTLSMARTEIIDSATSQFFINLKDNTPLDHKGETLTTFGYCVFAKVIDGMDTVDKIAQTETGTIGFHRDVPTSDILIEKVEIID